MPAAKQPASSPSLSALSLPAPTPPHTGLSSEEARRRRDTLGANELRRSIRIGPLRQIAASLASPLMLILLAASAVAAWMGQLVDAAIIVVTVTASVLLDAVQTARSTSAADRLRQTIVPTATVFRDGHWIELPRADVVPGDLIHLSAGDLVPADARVVESRDLHVEQAALTGESFPAEKMAPSAQDTTAIGVEPADPRRADLVFLGTSIAAGYALAEVTATGSRTAFGDIAARLGDAPPETAFARGLRDLSRLLSETVVFLVLFLLLVSIVLRRDPLQSLLFAVALAVGVVPEFMPMITTLTLSSGAVRMARRRVIVKHLAAIQNFGGIDVLCSDKTGTLTRGSMSLLASLEPGGRESVDVLTLGALNARFGSGVRNPLDDAILAAAPPPELAWAKADELPFDFERRRASVVLDGQGERLLVTKGAPESVLSCCETYVAGGSVLALDEPARRVATALVQALGEQGTRVLAVATRRVPARSSYGHDDEVALTLHGFLTFEDQPLPGAAQAIAALAADGVTVKIISGDDAAVARHVCERTGLPHPRVVLGDELDAVSDAAIRGLMGKETYGAARQSNSRCRARGVIPGLCRCCADRVPRSHR